MKILFMPIPGIGHTFPMVPLAWALRSAGHDVMFLSGHDGLEVAKAGFAVIDPIPNMRIEQEFAAVSKDAPTLFESMSHLTIEQILALKPMVVKPWDRFVDPYVAEALRVGPDLIISDPVFSAGMVAASLLGIPAIAHGYMLVRFTADILREHAAVAFDRHGVDLPEKTGLIDIGPPSLMEPGPSTWQMRYVPFNGGSVLPAWLLEPPTRPRIAVTLGTPLPHRMGPGRFDSIIAAAREVDAEFALMVNEATAATLGPLPENVRPTGWVPLYQLAKTCTATINHGGSGTLFTAAVAGLPQLIVPDGADNDYNSRILRDFGCGLVAAPGKVEAEQVRTLLSDDSLRQSAEKLRQEIQGMRSPADLVDEIVAFAES